MTAWEPATAVEVALSDALRAQDQDLYFRILSRADLLLPVAAPPVPGATGAGWGTWATGGRTHVLAFTSPAALAACLGAAAGNTRWSPTPNSPPTGPTRNGGSRSTPDCRSRDICRPGSSSSSSAAARTRSPGPPSAPAPAWSGWSRWPGSARTPGRPAGSRPAAAQSTGPAQHPPAGAQSTARAPQTPGAAPQATPAAESGPPPVVIDPRTGLPRRSATATTDAGPIRYGQTPPRPVAEQPDPVATPPAPPPAASASVFWPDLTPPAAAPAPPPAAPHPPSPAAGVEEERVPRLASVFRPRGAEPATPGRPFAAPNPPGFPDPGLPDRDRDRVSPPAPPRVAGFFDRVAPVADPQPAEAPVADPQPAEAPAAAPAESPAASGSRPALGSSPEPARAGAAGQRPRRGAVLRRHTG